MMNDVMLVLLMVFVIVWWLIPIFILVANIDIPADELIFIDCCFMTIMMGKPVSLQLDLISFEKPASWWDL